MKKIMLLMVILVLSICFVGCESKTAVSSKAIDCRYTEAYTEIVTEYEHKYSWIKGDFVLVPNTHSEHRPAKYEILYLISYDDGTTDEQWKEVDKATYMSFKGGAE